MSTASGSRPFPQPVPHRLADWEPINDPERLLFVAPTPELADKLWKLGLMATAKPPEAGRWLVAWRPHFRDRNVIILAERKAGESDRVNAIAASVDGEAGLVKVVPVPTANGETLGSWLDGEAAVQRAAARLLGIGRDRLRRLLAAGVLRSVPVPGGARIPRAEIDRVVREGLVRPRPRRAAASGELLSTFRPGPPKGS
jgi:excisionase family DNA binding protein